MRRIRDRVHRRRGHRCKRQHQQRDRGDPQDRHRNDPAARRQQGQGTSDGESLPRDQQRAHHVPQTRRGPASVVLADRPSRCGRQDDGRGDGPLRRSPRQAQWHVADSVPQADGVHRLKSVNLLVWLVPVATGLVVVFLIFREIQRNRLEQLRAAWGTESPRVHRMEDIAASHRSRLTSRREALALDDRTWDDLVLDEVFTRFDRTESTLGRHALYHRLRTAHPEESLHAFESLVTRLSVDAAARERVQLALGRLRDPQGYDLWWLARP